MGGANSMDCTNTSPTGEGTKRSTSGHSKAEKNSNKQVRSPGHDWSKIIARTDKKFVCLLCRRYIYNGRTEVIFHSVTRHLMVVSQISAYFSMV